MSFSTVRAAHRISSVAALLLPLIVAGIPGDRVSAQDPAPPSEKEKERKRFEEMARIVRRFEVAAVDDRGQETTAIRSPEPLHRWIDPTREFSGGALWAWRSSGRPVAIIAIELYGAWSLEFVSLSTGRVMADDGAIHWAPSKGGVEFQDMPGAPAPAADEARRLRQMRDLARTFTASEFWAARHHPLRLLPHPIDRFADPASGLVDGAMFIYANGTNPEVLLLIEARRSGDGPPRWTYAAAPLSKAELKVKLGARDVWTCPSKGERSLSRDEPYYVEMSPRRGPGL